LHYGAFGSDGVHGDGIVIQRHRSELDSGHASGELQH
jgi:hypothetical protein